MNDHKNNNCEIFFEDGTSAKVFSDWLHNENLDHWEGWSCDAGITRISIEENFDVYSARCRNDYLGNLNNEWKLLEESICKREQCTGCTDDLVLKKGKLND
jgi:hypothetical protein